MQWFIESLREHPELALFLALALGHTAGRVKLGSFQPGPVLGCLFCGVLVGQLGIPVPEALQNMLFFLFLFAIGYNTGPLFFRALRATAGPQIALTVVSCVTALLSVWAVSRLFGLDAASAGGLIAGAMTSAAALGTAGDALLRLGIDEALLAEAVARQTVVFAVTYLLGMGLIVWVLGSLAPRLLRVDLAAECRRLEIEMGVGGAEDETLQGHSVVELRTYQIEPALAGLTVAALEARFEGARVFVERIRGAGGVIEAPPGEQRLEPGDRVLLCGRREILIGAQNPFQGNEVNDPQLQRIPIAVANVFFTSKEFAGTRLGMLADKVGARGVFLRRITRAGTELPFAPGTIAERGDVLELVGSRAAVERVADRVGYAEWPDNATDLATVSAAILLGGLIGLPTVMLGEVGLGLSLFVGVLVAGLVFGWLRSIYPVFGRIPEPSVWLFSSFGLTGFLALVGIQAGPGFLAGLQESGLVLITAGCIVTMLAPLVTLLFGKFVFKLHPGILLGVCCGAATSAPALAVVEQKANSKVPALGYGVGCALGNVILAIWGGVAVFLMSI